MKGKPPNLASGKGITVEKHWFWRLTQLLCPWDKLPNLSELLLTHQRWVSPSLWGYSEDPALSCQGVCLAHGSPQHHHPPFGHLSRMTLQASPLLCFLTPRRRPVCEPAGARSPIAGVSVTFIEMVLPRASLLGLVVRG